MSDIIYECTVCGNKAKAPRGKPAPLCCKKKMEPLPYCTKVSDAEMSRFADEDGPCDDGIVKKKR